MTTYAITGGHGFLGWHLRCRLKAEQPTTEVRLFGRGQLEDVDGFSEALIGCDAIFHLAGVNSHDPQAAAENVCLAEALAAAVERLPTPPRIVYSNSTHIERANEYGKAKRTAAEVLFRSAERSGGSLADVVLPNLFGECAKPHYNSAVATFCDAVVNGTPAEVNAGGSTELLHAQDAAVMLLGLARPGPSVLTRVSGELVQIANLYDKIARYHETYRDTHIVPAFRGRNDIRLFNQLRAAMYPGAYPVELISHSDHRGSFFEAVRGSGEGQTSFSTTLPGVTRGEHWHADKIERFLVLGGRATIAIRRLFYDDVQVFEVSGDSPAFVDMPTLHAHNITNIGDGELLTMFWANDHYRNDAPDTWPERVVSRQVVAS